MTRNSVLLLFFFIHIGIGGKNTSGSTHEQTTCDGEQDCNLSTKETVIESTTEGKWNPFRYESSSVWVSLESLYPAYVKWHKETLYDASILCQEKKVLVFTPNAGLGDSIGALTAAFHYVIKTGRLLFINWKPYDWSIGLKPLHFHYDYATAKSLRDPASQKSLLCVEESNDPASFMAGHVTSDHAIVNDPVINDYHFGADKLAKTLLQPSKKVKEIMETITDSEESKTSKKKGTHSQTVAIVMRTGEGEYNQFLSKGDEENFVKCFRNYAKLESKKSQGKINFRVFVTSDNEKVKKKVAEDLKNGDNGELSIEVLTLNDSIVHVMHVEENAKKKTVLKKIRKTYAEFFFIGQCDVLFLTHGSLFGRAAAERGKAKEANVHYLSDSNCDGKREKYSYLQCHNPKYPPVCGFS